VCVFDGESREEEKKRKEKKRKEKKRKEEEENLWRQPGRDPFVSTSLPFRRTEWLERNVFQTSQRSVTKSLQRWVLGVLGW
jgi:hypothetical protein